MNSQVSQTRFTFRAADSTGRIQQGTVDAVSRRDAVSEISARRLLVVSLVEVSAASSRGSALPASELATGLFVLADLLDSGIPLGRALSALESIVSPRWRAALPAVRRNVSEGGTLAQSLDQSALAIPDLVVGIVEAGERGGGLAASLRTAAEICQERADTREAITSALTYPVMLACAGTASVAMLVGVVLPRFAGILGEMGQELPLSTRLVLSGGELGRLLLLPSAALATVSFLLWRSWASSMQGRRSWHRGLLAVPVIGGIRHAAASARLSAALSALLSTGIQIVPALADASRAAGDAAVEERALAARTAIAQGERPSIALERSRAVTELTIRLVRAGEESGRLAAMLSHAARLERANVTRMLRSAIRLIEPAMIVLFGGVVALVAASLLQALYSVRPT